MKWCEHITGIPLADDYNYCCICGAKRPEEPKELHRVLSDEHWNGPAEWTEIANTAKRWFIERCEAALEPYDKPIAMSINGIKQAIDYKEHSEVTR